MKITPTTVLDFKVAQPNELPLVMEILAEAAAWLKEKGIDQWPSPPNKHWQRRMAEAIQREEVYTVGIVKNRFGVVCFTWNDPHWPDDNLAGYVPLMGIRSEMHGQNLGGLIFFWAMLKAKRERKQFLRLSCAAENGRLRRYYETQAFHFRGLVTHHDYQVALYEKPI
jgi:hypothetical protein